MTRRITLTIALALSVVFLSLMSSDSTAVAQQRMKFRADTGLVKLGRNQVLRLDVTFDRDVNNNIADEARALVRFSTVKYVQGGCNSDGVCKHITAGSVTSGPYTLASGEAASIVTDNVDPDEFLGRVVVVSNRRNMRATATIISTVTGETTSHIIIANTEGDVH
jgi:hypothetical protein